MLYSEFGFDSVAYSGPPELEKCYGDEPRIKSSFAIPDPPTTLTRLPNKNSGRAIRLDTGFGDWECLNALGGTNNGGETYTLNDY